MNSSIVPHLTPEEIELKAKTKELEKSEIKLVEKEGDLLQLKTSLQSVEKPYYSLVHPKLVEIDELEAQRLEYELLSSPNDPILQQKAENARSKAEASKQAQIDYDNNDEPLENFIQPINFQPSKEAKKIYYYLARLFHPDLTTNLDERCYRNKMMRVINMTFANGDEDKLRRLFIGLMMEQKQSEVEVEDLMNEYLSEDINTLISRTVQEILQVNERIEQITQEIHSIKQSPLYALQQKAILAQKAQRNLLREIAERLEQKIAKLTSLIEDKKVHINIYLERLIQE